MAQAGGDEPGSAAASAICPSKCPSRAALPVPPPRPPADPPPARAQQLNHTPRRENTGNTRRAGTCSSRHRQPRMNLPVRPRPRPARHARDGAPVTRTNAAAIARTAQALSIDDIDQRRRGHGPPRAGRHGTPDRPERRARRAPYARAGRRLTAAPARGGPRDGRAA